MLPTIVDRAFVHSGTDRVVLVVDQFEELYTLVGDQDRRVFLDALLHTSSRRPLSVVLTIRADFYGRVLGEHRGLSDALSRALVNVGPLVSDELRVVVEKPAGLVGLTFEAGLVDRILDEVGGQPGRLPLLQFALAGLWAGRRGSTLTHLAFERMGGVAGSIGSRAEAVYDQLTLPQRDATAVLMKRLVRVDAADEETTYTKRVAHRSDLTDVAWQVGEATRIHRVACSSSIMIHTPARTLSKSVTKR